MSGTVEEEEANYFSKDFEWETLKQEIENNPSFSYHLLPFVSSSLAHGQESGDSNAWQRFHVRHSTGRFFKERRYLLKEFPELVSCRDFSKVLEVGCGNGSSVIPILRGNKRIFVYACDCSNETLDRAQEIVNASNIVSVQGRFKTFYSDFAFTGFPKWLLCDSCRLILPHKQEECLSSDVKERSIIDVNGSGSLEESGCCIGGVDFVTLIFTLSAVSLKMMPTAILECLSVLKPGGLLLFRDYGLYDMTMLRFEANKRVGFREYMRADGTRSYFFSLDTVRDLFVGAGFIELELEYCCVKSVNRRKGKSMRRVWIHGKFQKPVCEAAREYVSS
ncbi:tRNA N(3)-methylcytidine methyltransferase METTL6 [Ricinus communis]|uniref:tRNA N(3)-methylcytidine methyltransferase METTL6 n=1 Tax=Ricinus communis TaxID=3988 RepID=UPI00201A4F38|nr:tRNA N(3)-methylcytidine methyltransferase METTL6 [Ricinus communis]